MAKKSSLPIMSSFQNKGVLLLVLFCYPCLLVICVIMINQQCAWCSRGPCDALSTRVQQFRVQIPGRAPRNSYSARDAIDLLMRYDQVPKSTSLSPVCVAASPLLQKTWIWPNSLEINLTHFISGTWIWLESLLQKNCTDPYLFCSNAF